MSLERTVVFLVAAAASTALAEESSTTCDAFASSGGECLRQAATEGRAMLQMKGGHGSAMLEPTVDTAAIERLVTDMTQKFQEGLKKIVAPIEAHTVQATAKTAAKPLPKPEPQPAPFALVSEGALAKFQELKRRVQQMRKEGQDPAGVAHFITHQLLPTANATKAELQNEVNHAQQSIENCNSQLATSESGAREQETTLSIGESRHNECSLEHQQKLKNANDDCQAVQQLCDTMNSPPSVAEVDLNDTQAVLDALEANYQFLQQEFPTFMQESQTCTAATNEADGQQQQCDTDLANLEASFCSLKAARQGICSDYSACFQEKKDMLQRVINDVMEVENYTKSTFQVLSCHAQTFLRDGVTCDPSAIDVTALDVFYPGLPTMESCSDEVSTSWNYSASVCDGPSSDAGGEDDGMSQAGGNGTANVSTNASLLQVHGHLHEHHLA